MAIRRRLAALLLALITALGILVFMAPSASAYTKGHVYLVVFNHRCIHGGNVVQITGAVDWVWSGGDYGDNIIYPKVEFGRDNAFNGRALCNRSKDRGGPYWINVPYWQFHPTGWNQTFYY